MAIELHIFMESARVPSLDAWQRAIDHLGFSTSLEPPFDLRVDTGFRPAAYKNQSTGFEFYLEPAEDILSSYPHVRSKVGGRDQCATFRWGGNLTECAAALSSASALTMLADGVYFYPDDDILLGAEDAVELTRRELSSI